MIILYVGRVSLSLAPQRGHIAVVCVLLEANVVLEDDIINFIVCDDVVEREGR